MTHPPNPRPSMLATAAVLVALLATAGCQDASDPEFTPVPPSSYTPGSGVPAGGDSARPADPQDSGADGDDSGAEDVSVDRGPDMAPVVDATVEPARMCSNDDDCVLAVDLPSCEPCPVAAHVEDVLADRCLAVYVQGATIGAYAPADCWADCGDAIGRGCFDAPAAAVCDPPRSVGQCALFR